MNCLIKHRLDRITEDCYIGNLTIEFQQRSTSRTDAPDKPTPYPDPFIQPDRPAQHRKPLQPPRSVTDNMSQEMKSYSTVIEMKSNGTVIDINSHHSVSRSRFG